MARLLWQPRALRRPPRVPASVAPVRKKRWVVYAKPRSPGPRPSWHLCRATSTALPARTAASLRFNETGVTFQYKNYRCDGVDRQQVMTISADEFIRRFLLHVLPPQPFQRCFASPEPWAAPPKGCHRIHQYGLLAGATRKARLDHVRQLLGVAPPAAADAPDDPPDIRPPCPCRGGHMVTETFERWRQPRAPPLGTGPTGTTTSRPGMARHHPDPQRLRFRRGCRSRRRRRHSHR